MVDKLTYEELEQRVKELEKESVKHKQTEEELRESEKRYSTLSEASFEGVLIHEKGKIIDANNRFAEMYGYKLDELIGTDALKLIPLEHRDTVRNNIASEHEGPYEVLGLRKDSSTFHTKIRVRHMVYYGRKVRVAIARDITARKKVEEALRESEEKYRLMFETMNEGVCLHEIMYDETGEAIDYKIIDVNPSYEFITGLKKERAIGSNASELYGIGEPPFLDIYAKVADTGEPTTFEIFWPVMEKYFYISVISPDKGKFATVFTDLTERRQEQKALRESEEKYRTILESIEDGYFEVDIAGNFTFFNDSLCKILAYSKDELMGMNNRQYTDEESAKKLYKTFNKVYTTGKPDKGFDWEIIRKDGGKRYVEASVSLRKDPEGQPTGFRGIVRDITERKKVGEALRESEERYRALFQHNPVGTVVVDNEARITMYNFAKEKAGGRLPNIGDVMYKEYAGKHQINMFEELVECIRSGDQKKFLDLKYEERFLNIMISPFSGGAIITSIDITERKQTEEQIKVSLKEKEILLQEIHHRVKNNMQIISSLLKLQASGVGDERVSDALMECQGRVQTMAFVHETLYGSDTLAVIDFKTYISKLANQIFQTFKTSMDRVKLEVDAEDIKLGIEQATPLGLISNELLSNSLKYAFPENRSGEIVIRIRAVEQDSIEFVFSDNGIGIPEALDWRNTDSLGLRLVIILTDQLDGTVSMDRRKGTHFTVRFKHEENQ